MTWSVDYRSGHAYEASTDVISAIRNIRIPANSNILKDIVSGSPYPSAAHVVAVVPSISFESLDLTNALDSLGAAGQCTTDFAVFAQKQDCSGVLGGLSHFRYAVAKGAIVPTSLTVDHQGNAAISYDIYAASTDGSADPIVRSSNQTLPTANPGKRYELYRCDFGGVTLEGKRNVTINWNPSVSQDSADGTKYPTTVTLSSVQPVMTCRGVDPTWAINLDGMRGTKVNTILYLKDRDELAASLSHISLAMDCAISWNTLFDGTPDAPGEAEIQADAYEATGAAPITVTTGIALP